MDNQERTGGGQPQQQASYRHPMPQISDALRGASSVVLITAGPDGKPQVWASGDERQAKDLFTRSAETLGIKEFASS